MYSKILSFLFIIIVSTTFVFAQVSSEERAKLEAELKALEAESTQILEQLKGKKGERQSLERDLSLISGKISASKNKIKKISATIMKLSGEIGEREGRINVISNRIDKNRTYIIDAVNKIRKIDDTRALVALSGNKVFSDVFVDRGDLEAINVGLASNIDNLENNKKFIEVEKEVLEDKKEETVALKQQQENEKKKVEATKKEKDAVLKVTKGEEKQYQLALDEKQKKITSIKNRLFTLRDAGAISFDKAQTYAVSAGKSTGVRPALILGILKQESNLGSNDGRCYLKDAVSGSGVRSTTGDFVNKVMNPTRDVPVFIDLMTKIGRDPYNTRISCPVPGIGWGGAMGPTQFIPSTWVRYANRVAAITGSSDPWSARDAITATALYLADSGASGGGYANERNAACRYYSGRACSSGAAAAGYGNSVMRHTENFQADIDLLQGD